MFAGVIYVMTNPSFPDFVKIGFATDAQQRLTQLNRSECVPFAFRLYATYDVTEALQDKELHALIDRLNPDLRSMDMFDGRPRVREFYAMSAEDAYALLESIARLSGTLDRLHKFELDGLARDDLAVAAEVKIVSRERRSPFSFSKCGIPVGSRIVLVGRPDVIAEVVGDRQIVCNGEEGSLSAFAERILGLGRNVQGTLYWMYEGQILNDLRLEREQAGLYV